jgi:hypothetical protein
MHDHQHRVNLLLAMLLTAMAAGMGWGIRGQFGHESGAMIAGTLASLTLVMLFIPQASSLVAARAAAMMTVAIGIGGTMTYGQTVGLTHDRELVGNWEALRWGMLGLMIKGGIWIGFGGVFLGMGLGGKQYRPLEVLVVLLVMIGLVFLGLWLINSPFDPAKKLLPRIYFSDSWYFEPDKADMKPRREVWGGLLLALIGLVLYVAAVRRDWLAARLAFIGFVAGGLGFPGGQSLQAFHSWNTERFNSGDLAQFKVFQYFNWWNMMETTFGLIFGAVLALGLWLNRKRIAVSQVEPDVALTPTTEACLISLHLGLLLTAEFLRLPGSGAIVSSYIDLGLFMCVLPIIGIVGGRIWPYAQLLVIVAAPICGKQIRNLVYAAEPQYSVSAGWVAFALVPMGILFVVTVYLASSSRRQHAQWFAATALLTTTWLYFGLNTVFFSYAWPWDTWTARTPNQIIFSVCAVCLSMAAVGNLWRKKSFNG